MAETGPSGETNPIEVVQPSTGRTGTYHAPKHWTKEQIDTKLGELKAERVKTWGEYAYDHLVPKTPTEWAITGAAAAPALLTGGAAAIPMAAGKQALQGVARAVGGGALRRIGTTTAAGAVGAIFDPTLAKEEPARRIGRGGTEGALVGLVGEATAIPITYATKWGLDKWIKTSSAQNLGKQMGHIDAIFKNNGTPADMFRVAFMNGTDEAASEIYRKGIANIIAKDKTAGVQSQALSRMVEKMGMKEILPAPYPGTQLYSIESAFTILSEAGDFAFEAGKAKDTGVARSLIRLREQAFEDLKGHWKGTGLMEDFQAVNLKYGRQKTGLALLRNNWQQVFPRGRADIDTAQVTENLIQMMEETGPTVRAKLKPELDEIWQTFFRGRDPGARDLPGVSPSLRGGRAGYGRPSAFFGVGAAPYRAGASEAIETAVPSTVETLGGTMMRQKSLQEIERKSLEERIFGPRPVGGVPG